MEKEDEEFWKDMNSETWIIAYTHHRYGWLGCFPSYIHQWIVTHERSGYSPKFFDSKEDAQAYIDNNFLVSAIPVDVTQRNNFKD